MHDHRLALAGGIRALRERRGIRPSELAEKVGVRRETLSRWENGTSGIDTSNLFALLDALGADLYDLGVEARKAVGGELPTNGESGPRVGRLRLTEVEWAQLEEEARATAVQMVRDQMRGLRGDPDSPGPGP